MFNWFKKKGIGGNGPDFSAIDSKAKAEDLFQKGELKKLFLMPLEFGGEDFGMNVVYVPEFAAEMKANIDSNIIKPLADQGKIKHYQALPQYQGNSFIPCAIKIVASEPGNFVNLIRIWGDGLNVQ
jgi:hypothetical protein